MKNILFAVAIGLIGYVKVNAQENNAALANNPLANLTALNFHNYYIPKLTDAPSDGYVNTTWIRFAKPLANGKLLFRLSVPMNTVAIPNEMSSVDAKNGLGDINAFLSYSFISQPISYSFISQPTAAARQILN